MFDAKLDFDLCPEGKFLLDPNGDMTSIYAIKVRELAGSDGDFDRKFLEERGKSFERTMFPNNYQDGDIIYWYRDMQTLSGWAGYILIRARRLVAVRRTILS